MNALRAPLTALPVPKEICRLFLLDSADALIDGDGTQARRRPLLDVAQGMGLPAAFEVRFACGAARNRPWCEVDHRPFDWDTPLPSRREFEIVIMVEVAIG